MVEPWWHEVVSLLVPARKTDSAPPLLPLYPRSGGQNQFRWEVLQTVFIIYTGEIWRYKVLTWRQCVPVIGHAHTNKPQPAPNKIQVRTSEEWRYIKIKKKKKVTGRIRSSLSLRKNCVVEAFRSTSGWSLRVVVTDRVKLRGKFETQAWMLHPRGLLCETLGQQASEGGGSRLQDRWGRHRKSRWSSAVLTIPGNLWLSAGSWL